jgi:hypothetical protein
METSPVPVVGGGIGGMSFAIRMRHLGWQVDDGAPRTPYMSFADTVRIEVVGLRGETVFGVIDQRVGPAQGV